VNEKFVVVGNVSDSPFAIDVSRLLGLNVEVSDMISLKQYANSEFCPRYIGDEDLLDDKIGKRLEGHTVIICSTTSLQHDRNALAMRNLILARGAKDNGAKRVVLVEPDLFFSAQDRGPYNFGDLEKDRSLADRKKFDGQPFTALLYAQMLKLSGVDTVVTVHNHSIKVQDLFREVFEGDFHNLIPTDVYADYIRRSDFVSPGRDGSNLVLCAPDKGAEPFMKMVHESLGLPQCKRIILQKVRTGERHVSMTFSPESDITLEEIAGKDVIVLDDMVRTGNTIVQCCELLQTGNPGRVCFGVTHFHTSPEARENLSAHSIDEIMTTNTISTILNRDEQGRLRKKLVVLKIGKWVSRYLLKMFDMDASRYEKDSYSIDMSSQNHRWPPPMM
jgi:ribose-phosphate pyrophosphokinase